MNNRFNKIYNIDYQSIDFIEAYSRPTQILFNCVGIYLCSLF